VSDRELTEQSAETLRCVECGARSTDGIGWRALLTAGDEEAEDHDEVAISCPQCAGREFGKS
jgi:hypothetical protein